MSPLTELTATCGCIAAAVVDARTGYIPDRITAMTACAAVACAAYAGEFADAVSGASVSGAALYALYALTRRRGLGFGDVKLGIVIGAGFGATCGIVAIATAFVAGGAYGVWLLSTRRARLGTAVRFGPFLAAGALSVEVAAWLLPATRSLAVRW